MPGASALSSSVYSLRSTSSVLAASVGAPLLSPPLLSVLPSILHTSFSPSILKTLTNGLPVLQSSSCFLEELYQRPLTCPYRLYLTPIHPVHTHTHTHTRMHTCMHTHTYTTTTYFTYTHGLPDHLTVQHIHVCTHVHMMASSLNLFCF